MAQFNQSTKTLFERLNQYVPIVDRVHGNSHPEFHDVKAIFDQINDKVQNADSTSLNLEEEFAQLKTVTDNYRIPDDVCESYEAVYQMLEELETIYRGNEPKDSI